MTGDAVLCFGNSTCRDSIEAFKKKFDVELPKSMEKWPFKFVKGPGGVVFSRGDLHSAEYTAKKLSPGEWETDDTVWLFDAQDGEPVWLHEAYAIGESRVACNVLCHFPSEEVCAQVAAGLTQKAAVLKKAGAMPSTPESLA